LDIDAEGDGNNFRIVSLTSPAQLVADELGSASDA